MLIETRGGWAPAWYSPLRWLALPRPLARRIRWLARIWVSVAIVVFLGLALREGLPYSMDLGAWQQPAQLALIVLVALGGLLAWRWEALGASILAFGAVFLGVLASVEYEPRLAFFACLAFFVPAFLFWLVWQFRQPPRAVISLALVMALLLGVGAIASVQTYGYLFGPAHPQSTLRAKPVDRVESIWSGAVTETSAVVTAKLARDSESVRLAFSERDDLADARYTTATTANDDTNQRVVKFALDGLRPDTRYAYAVESDGKLDRSRQGTFRTFPSGAASFSFAFGSCARVGSNGAVFDTIRAAEPLFYLIDGDIHYEYIETNDPDRFRDALDTVLSRPAQAALYASVPTIYAWDDHDYGPNDGDKTSPTRSAAREVYRQYVPHYPLPAGDGDAAIYQAFSVGRVRFIVTDLRSERTPDSEPDGAAKSMLGAEQKAWLKQELLAAKERYALIVLVSSVPWIDAAGEGKDSWGGFATERREIADFIAANRISGVLMLSGDAHMLAIDDGTNSDYSTSGGAGFPVMHAAALDKAGAAKGGPFSEGAYPGAGQFGFVTVEDDGDSLTVTLSGRNWKGEEIVGYVFAVDPSAQEPYVSPRASALPSQLP
jgi:phosphodiesterase/alkaline phosphatase D-like protein